LTSTCNAQTASTGALISISWCASTGAVLSTDVGTFNVVSHGIKIRTECRFGCCPALAEGPAAASGTDAVTVHHDAVCIRWLQQP
jgi:hypothetical protein